MPQDKGQGSAIMARSPSFRPHCGSCLWEAPGLQSDAQVLKSRLITSILGWCHYLQATILKKKSYMTYAYHIYIYIYMYIYIYIYGYHTWCTACKMSTIVAILVICALNFKKTWTNALGSARKDVVTSTCLCGGAMFEQM